MHTLLGGRGKRQSKRGCGDYFTNYNGILSIGELRKTSCGILTIIASKWLNNVWSKFVEKNFHMAFVVCVSAMGTVTQQLLIVPGNRTSRDVMQECNIQGACVTTAPKVFMNSTLLLKWIELFASYVSDSFAQPLVLVYDGYCSNLNDNIVAKAIEIKTILVLLPANSTHLIQSLYIDVSKPLNAVLKYSVEDFILEGANTII